MLIEDKVGEQIAVAVVLAMTGQSLASFRAGSDCTAADVLQKLAREAPLPDGQSYTLLVNDQPIEASQSLSGGFAGETLEIAAFIVRDPLPKLRDHPCSRRSRKFSRASWAPSMHAAHMRDWEFHDDPPCAFVLPLLATCTLLNIELKKKSAGLYGDFPSMVHPLPLLDRQGAARAFAEGLLEIKPLLDVLDRYRP